MLILVNNNLVDSNSQQSTVNRQQSTVNSQHGRILNFFKNYAFIKLAKNWDISIYPLIKIRKIANRIFVCDCYLINYIFKRRSRMKKVLVLLFTIVMLTTSCMAHRHVIGNGPQTGVKTERRQWYALWGLVRIGDVNIPEMAGGASDYEIYTRVNGVDWIIDFFLSWTTIQSRSVRVTK